jgi:hypothetical protein
VSFALIRDGKLRNQTMTSHTRKAMNRKPLVVVQACLAIVVGALFSFTARASTPQQPAAKEVVFFDVSDIPARIDAPKLSKDNEPILDCAVANRAGEQLLGIRLILLVIDPGGNLRSRITWTERADVAMYSIKTFTFHPEMKGELRSTDQLFLGIEEVFGRDTIWRAVGAEKALRAYSRGQHDVVPAVRTFANKYDRQPGVQVIHER